MSAFLSNAVSFVPWVVPPCTCYLLNRVFPAPHAGFIVVASSVATYTFEVFFVLGFKWAQRLSEKYKIKIKGSEDCRQVFYNLTFCFTSSMGLLLPIIGRAVGQKMGYPVPGYLQTFSYFALTNTAFRTSKRLFSIKKAVGELYTQNT